MKRSKRDLRGVSVEELGAMAKGLDSARMDALVSRWMAANTPQQEREMDDAPACEWTMSPVSAEVSELAEEDEAEIAATFADLAGARQSVWFAAWVARNEEQHREIVDGYMKQMRSQSHLGPDEARLLALLEARERRAIGELPGIDPPKKPARPDTPVQRWRDAERERRRRAAAEREMAHQRRRRGRKQTPGQLGLGWSAA